MKIFRSTFYFNEEIANSSVNNQPAQVVLFQSLRFENMTLYLFSYHNTHMHGTSRQASN